MYSMFAIIICVVKGIQRQHFIVRDNYPPERSNAWSLSLKSQD